MRLPGCEVGGSATSSPRDLGDDHGEGRISGNVERPADMVMLSARPLKNHGRLGEHTGRGG
jgi:hypothetical protein